MVQYKQQSRLEEKRKKAMDLHLSFIVDQTEKYSSWLTEEMAKSQSRGPSSVGSPGPSSGVDGRCWCCSSTLLVKWKPRKPIKMSGLGIIDVDTRNPLHQVSQHLPKIYASWLMMGYKVRIWFRWMKHVAVHLLWYTCISVTILKPHSTLHRESVTKFLVKYQTWGIQIR